MPNRLTRGYGLEYGPQAQAKPPGTGRIRRFTLDLTGHPKGHELPQDGKSPGPQRPRGNKTHDFRPWLHLCIYPSMTAFCPHFFTSSGTTAQARPSMLHLHILRHVPMSSIREIARGYCPAFDERQRDLTPWLTSALTHLHDSLPYLNLEPHAEDYACGDSFEAIRETAETPSGILVRWMVDKIHAWVEESYDLMDDDNAQRGLIGPLFVAAGIGHPSVYMNVGTAAEILKRTVWAASREQLTAWNLYAAVCFSNPCFDTPHLHPRHEA